MNIYTKHTTIVGAANAHIDELIDYGLATEADKSPTIEGVIGNLAKIYSENFNVKLDDEYSHTAADQMAALLEVVGKKAASENPLTALAIDVDIDTTVDLLGKYVTDLQEDVEIDGNYVTGTIKYVDDYTDFSSDPSLQSGHYIVLHAAIEDVDGATITVKHTRTVTLDEDGILILHIASLDTPVVYTATKPGYRKVTKTIYLNKLTLEEAGD